ncbi:MAG: hypothetical protein GX102_01755 [Porphyromonadaceae bacterium]|nr:hypothetical protein [Porphyromonadaceae bacterium]
MKKLLTKTGIALTVLMMLATTAVAQTVNMDRYITLTVEQGKQIGLSFSADADNTGVKVVSGTQETTITVGTIWTDLKSYHAGADTMTIYGNVRRLDCSNNGTELTGLDASKNTGLTSLFCNHNSLTALDVSGLSNLSGLYCYSSSLTTLDLSGLSDLSILYCYGNKFTTDALNDIYCALPERTASDNARIFPAYNSSSSNHAIVLATNKQNAIDKGWNVLYGDVSIDIPTTGKYVCGSVHPVNMSRYITLTVKQGELIQLNLAAEAANTSVKVVSGTEQTTLLVGTDWTGGKNYLAGATTMTIYGNVKQLDCYNNTTKLTGLNLSNNTGLTYLNCSHNSLTALDVSGLSMLTRLECNRNSLTTLNVSGLRMLTRLICNKNYLTDLDVSGHSKLTRLICEDNSLTTLDVSELNNLTSLDCGKNFLTTLDVSELNNLTELYCQNNSLNTLNVSRLSKLTRLICNDNSLTTLDVRGLSNLSRLSCHNNNFSTDALDAIYCALPARAASDNAYIEPVYNSSSSNHAIVMATNKQNAIDKGWAVRYFLTNSNIPTTTGTYKCPVVNMDRYITLTVQQRTEQQGVLIKLKLAADAANTGVKIVSGNEETTLKVGTDWTGIGYYFAEETEMTIYGNVKLFDCKENSSRLTGLDASNNTGLTELYCTYNFLKNIDVRGLSKLTNLSCYDNNLKALDLSGLSNLTHLYCYNNSLTALDVSGLSKLTRLDCKKNSLTTLDVSELSNLIYLNCSSNSITDLDVRGLSMLTYL